MWIAERQQQQTDLHAAYSSKDELLLLSNDWVHRGFQPCQITAVNTEMFKNKFRQQRNFGVTYGCNEKHSFSGKVIGWLELIHCNEASVCQAAFPLVSLDMISFLFVDDKWEIKLERHPSFPLRWIMVVMCQLPTFKRNKAKQTKPFF